MEKYDFKAVDPEMLVDIGKVSIDKSKTMEERFADFIRQIKNPYIFKYDEIFIKVTFNGSSDFEEKIKAALGHDQL